MKNSELLKKHYDKLIDEMIALEKFDPTYQIDLYIYPDGETLHFVNTGGNSWLDDNHVVVYSCNHEYGWDECRDEDGNFNADESYIREHCECMLDGQIQAYEFEENSEWW